MQRYLVSALALSLAATPALAQQAPESAITGRESTFSLTPYAGYMMFGKLANLSADTRLTNDDSWLVGAQAKIRMTSRWSVVGNAAYSQTAFRAESRSGSGGVNTSGDIGYWLADAGLQYQTPFAFRDGAVAPFVQAGIGAVRYTAEATSPSGGEGSTTNVQFNAGVGLDIDLGPVGMQLMLKDYVTSFDWNEVRDVSDQIRDDSIDRSRVANNLALTAGLRINF